MKHYSCSTEHSYLDWAARFFDNVTGVKQKELSGDPLTEEDIRDFLTYLAVKRRVASSTGNDHDLHPRHRTISNVPKSPLDSLMQTAERANR